MAEVIRWSTGKEMMNTTLQRETQDSLACYLALLYTLAGAQHKFDLKLQYMAQNRMKQQVFL